MSLKDYAYGTGQADGIESEGTCFICDSVVVVTLDHAFSMIAGRMHPVSDAGVDGQGSTCISQVI